MYWEAFYALTVLFSIVSTVALFGWMFWEVCFRDPGRKHGAHYEPDPKALRRLQAKRRLALRYLGDRWVLHASQPRVKWGTHRE